MKKPDSHFNILLALLPFWTPSIPPLGIACLKAFLRQHGYNAVTADANVEEEFVKINHQYFHLLSQCVPPSHRGNFYSIGNDVMQNHMMAHLNFTNEREYIELIKILIFKTFFCQADHSRVLELIRLIAAFYSKLERYILDLLVQHHPRVLGLSVFSGTLPASLFAFRLAKEKNPSIKTVMGGGIFSENLAPGSRNLQVLLEKTTATIDKIIIGEGELLFLKYLEGELPSSPRVYTLKDINGISLDLSSVGIPEFSDIKLQYYPNLTTYTSRSCPHQCSFCSERVYWGKYRKKRTAQVVRELQELYQKHGWQLFLMADSLLNPVITDLARAFLKESKIVYWDGYLRADNPVGDARNTMLWRRGGFYRARLGTESGSARVLELMGKKITPGQIKNAISSLAYAGIKTTTYWVIGYCGETEEDFQQTLDLVEELKSDIYEAEGRPFYYYLTGQTGSRHWRKKYKSVPLYPESAEEMLMFQTWLLDCEPSRQETFQRLNRFVQHCDKLGIPNPYSLYEIYNADERWQRLHRNSVPLLVYFKQRNTYVDDTKGVENIFLARNMAIENGDFAF